MIPMDMPDFKWHTEADKPLSANYNRYITKDEYTGKKIKLISYFECDKSPKVVC